MITATIKLVDLDNINGVRFFRVDFSDKDFLFFDVKDSDCYKYRSNMNDVAVLKVEEYASRKNKNVSKVTFL